MPAKVYHGPEEPGVDVMLADERQVNEQLAKKLFDDVMQKVPGTILDIGSKIPVLASMFGALGCDAYALDAVEPQSEAHVECLVGDFETMVERLLPHDCSLITLVHTFEHFYNPVGALRKLRKLLKPSGRLFMRIPDHNVRGFERDLTEHHYTIHPFFHCFTSILQALVELRDEFVVEWSIPLYPGQRDLILRPILRAPILGVAMIAKNEERDIARCLRSLEKVADLFVVVDTGSTDGTMDAASFATDVPTIVERYTDASELDETGDWKLWDFSKARNRSLHIAETCGVDWVIWADADEEHLTPQAIRRAIYWEQFDAYGMWISGDRQMQWVQYRMWKSRHDVVFKGRCHECAIIDKCRKGHIDDSAILHYPTPSPTQENSNPRNMRIMLREWQEDPSPRLAFYLANTYRDNDNHVEAAKWYQIRIDFGPGFVDEWLFSKLYLARSLRALARHDEADAISSAALTYAPAWSEFLMDLASGAYNQKKYDDAIAYCQKVDTTAVIPRTDLWRESQQYRDQPMRLISWAYEQKQDFVNAAVYARLALPLIGGPDASWEDRLKHLESTILEMGEERRPVVGLCRPGAIGDILMTLHAVPKLRMAYPGCDIWYFCSPMLMESLGPTMRAAGVDRVLPVTVMNMWMPHMVQMINLVGYPLSEGYPDTPMAKHLLEYFAAEMGVTVEEGVTLPRPVRPSFVPSGPYITLQTRTGWSAYKEWPADRWAKVVERLADLPIVCIDEDQGHTLQECIAAVANASMHLGLDSFANHLTHYRWSDEAGVHQTRGVILWGSTQAKAAGYDHNTNISKGLSCQPCFRENPAISAMPKGPCSNGSKVYGDGLHQCMQEISVDEVVHAVRTMWREEVGRAKYRVFGAAIAA